MSKEVLLFVDVLAKEKNLEKEIVFDSLEKAIAIATKKSFSNEYPDIEVSIDRYTGRYKTLRKWKIVSDSDFANNETLNDNTTIALSQAQKISSDLKLGDIIEEELENIILGRVAAQTVRNIITQRIKDAEREQVLHEYLSRNKRGILIGKVRKFDRGNVIVDCGRIEAMIMKKDLIPKEILAPGDQVKGYLNKDDLIVKNGRVLIQRANNEFLLNLLELNIPEISLGRIEVKGVARIPGIRAKVAVMTKDRSLDAKGACIGFRNQRVDSIMSEIAGEQVDFIEYDSNLATYAINALLPAVILSLTVDEQTRVIDVVVADENVGAAIGPSGTNVRLASLLTNCVINILGESQRSKQDQQLQQVLIEKFSEELDVDDEISEILVKHEFTNLDEIAYSDINELITIDDFDEEIATELQQRANNKILAKYIKYKEVIDKLEEELKPIFKVSRDMLLKLAEANVNDINDFADLSSDELMKIIDLDQDSANHLILTAREASGYFNE